MSSQDNYLDYLRRLPSKERTEEVHQELMDSLHELVRTVERTQLAEHAHIQGCVIDEILIDRIDLQAVECVVPLSFTATIELGEACTDRITGEAEAVFDPAGQVTFRNTALLMEHDFVNHDIGAGD